MTHNTTIHDLFDLTGKTFLVVGGARNLGHDMAAALAEAGAHGVITSRDESSARITAQQISADTGQDVSGLSLDATIEDEVEGVFSKIIAKFGKLDILVNCVGGGANAKDAPTTFEERPLSAWESLHRTNLTATFLLCKHAVPLMKRRGSGCIVNIASIAGIIGRDRRVYPGDMPPQSIDYASAKAGIIGMTRDLAAYLGPAGIRVNAISPGGFRRGQPISFIEAYSNKTPLRRMGRDGLDIKGAILFLCSEASAYVTGHNLVVDGGFTICQ